ncbi:hypothetical protein D7X30_34520 [Corallococcus sp. AB011P]|nr:hypothetical protein D7X30_34520 [Corallococcus sp. AB011P]RKH91817.1 hypothetical protein D7Y21_01120 [Corallococcus sp. AB045]
MLATFLGLACLRTGCKSNSTNAPEPSPSIQDSGVVDAGPQPVTWNLQAAQVQVPEGMRGAPFDVPRSLNIPSGMSVSVWARVPGARFIAFSPEGTLLVSVPGQNKVMQVRPRAGQAPEVTQWAGGLGRPHDIVFHERDGQVWVFLSEKDRVTRSRWTPGETTRGTVETVVTGLPDASLPELHGAYGHELKNLAVDSRHRVYVAIASTCNVCLSDTTSDPLRGAIYRWDWSGGSRELFARGLRNAEGLAWEPGTDTLWVAVNNRDNTPYPFHIPAHGGGGPRHGLQEPGPERVGPAGGRGPGPGWWLHRQRRPGRSALPHRPHRLAVAQRDSPRASFST